MMTSIEYILLGASILLFLSVIASKASGRLGVPALLIFLLIGMLAGSDGPGGIHFDNAPLAQSLGVVALAFILFAGGLETRWEAIRPELWKCLALSTLGGRSVGSDLSILENSQENSSWSPPDVKH